MEFPRGALILERVLALVMVGAALGVARVEAGSALAARAREGGTWLAWLEARERGTVAPPSLHLLVYDAWGRRLSVLHVPGDLKLDRRRTLDRAYLEALKSVDDRDVAASAAEDLAEARLRELSPEPLPGVSARLAVETAPLEEEDEPALAAAAELRARERRARTWASLLRRAWNGLRAGDRAAVEPLLFALELRRVAPRDVAPARLPGDAEAPALLARLLSSEPVPDNGRATTAEVLNGTGSPGLATRAAKMLRFKGVDVLTPGTARARERTVVYDRVGDFRRAAAVRAALGCPETRAVTRVDPARAVDVSVELGADCQGAFGSGESREP